MGETNTLCLQIHFIHFSLSLSTLIRSKPYINLHDPAVQGRYQNQIICLRVLGEEKKRGKKKEAPKIEEQLFICTK